MKPDNPTHCPNCGAEWNPEEREVKECFTCGFPDPYDPEIDDETED